MSKSVNTDEVARLVIPDELLTEYTSDAEPVLPEKSSWSKRRVIGFSSFYMAFYSAVIVTLVVLLPHQVESLVGAENKGKALGSMLTIGNVLLVIALPFTGLLSDKISTPIGKRKPFIIGGSLLFCVGLIGCALSTSYFMLCIFFSLLCLMNAFQTPSYQAVVQDLVPVQQRGIVSSVVNSFGQFGALLGGVYGLFLGTYLSTQSVYFILVGFYLVMLTISMLSFRERVQKPKERSKYDEIDVDVREYKPKNIGTWLKSFFYPMKSANFRWFLVMVFLNNCGDSLFRSFLQYYYLDSYKEFDFFGVLTFSRATAASGFSSVVMYSCAVCMSLASQWISKRVGRRVMSSFAQLFFLTAPIVLMLTQSFTLDIFMFIVYGIGYGMYNGVLWAFVADVVDDLFANSREDEHALISNAKDMGLWQTISLLSKVVVPGFGGFLLDTFQTIGKENNVPRLGYICIYSLAAFIFIMSGLAALKIKVKDKDQPKH